MGRKRPERENADLIKAILQSYQPETTQDIQEALKDFRANNGARHSLTHLYTYCR